MIPRVSECFGGEMARLPAEFVEPRWYAAYTCAKHEKRVAEQFSQRSLEHFLPQYESMRRWKDRRGELPPPLFSRHLFVRPGAPRPVSVRVGRRVRGAPGRFATPTASPRQHN